MTVQEYLKNETEATPEWLLDYKPGDKIYVEGLFRSRVVYYPGSGYDGQPIRTFNKAHFAHVFINVDYIITRDEIVTEFSRKGCLRGYKLLDIQDIPRDSLIPNGWTPTVRITPWENIGFVDRKTIPFCVAAVFEREAEYNESHGAERIVVIQLFADGIASYDAIFASRHKAPGALLIQDHGLGGNWASFGKNSILEKIARISNTLPEYICVIEGNEWNGYRKIENVEREIGGMWSNERYLFKR